MSFDQVITQLTADATRWVLLLLLMIFALWSGLSTIITWRNYRLSASGQGRVRTGWICLIFLFLFFAGIFDALLVQYRIGKTMSDYLFMLYLGKAVSYVLMVISASGFMLSLFGWRLMKDNK